MHFEIRNPVSLINTICNGFIPKNFAGLNLLQHCYDAIKTGDSNGFRPAKFSGRRTLSTVLLFNTDLT